MSNPLHGDGFLVNLPLLSGVSLQTLQSLNIPQQREENLRNLNALGGVPYLIQQLRVDTTKGLTFDQVELHRRNYGTNEFPASPFTPFLTFVMNALNDPTLIMLILASLVSLSVGVLDDPEKGWIEGAAICVAVILVSFITAANNYSKVS